VYYPLPWVHLEAMKEDDMIASFTFYRCSHCMRDILTEVSGYPVPHINRIRVDTTRMISHEMSAATHTTKPGVVLHPLRKLIMYGSDSPDREQLSICKQGKNLIVWHKETKSKISPSLFQHILLSAIGLDKKKDFDKMKFYIQWEALKQHVAIPSSLSSICIRHGVHLYPGSEIYNAHMIIVNHFLRNLYAYSKY